MLREPTNYAFIDSQNVNLGIQGLGWSLDWRKFRKYLFEKYAVGTAYIFIGFIPEHISLYDHLHKAGFILRFKPVLLDGAGRAKGNVDADLILRAMIDYEKYNKAVIVSSDGDFYSLVEYLYKKDKLEFVLSPHVKTCSSLLKEYAQERIYFMDKLRDKLQYIK